MLDDMTDTKPYFVRAFYEWIVDNDCTPMLGVKTSSEGVVCPKHIKEEDFILFNISSIACRNLIMTNESISFDAKFSGLEHNVYIPIFAVLSLITKENQKGIQFQFNIKDESKYQEKDKKDGKKVLLENTKNKEASKNKPRKKPSFKKI